jgi:DinB family protein
MPTTDDMRHQLLALLDGRGAHMTFEDAIADFPPDAINVAPPNMPYTPWHLVEHLRITQRDMLDYVIGPDYPRLDWPTDYWLARTTSAGVEQWEASVRAFLDDRGRLGALVTDPERDMEAPIAWTPGHSLLRCVRIIGNHNSYHVGELAILRQVTGSWPPDHV